MLDHSKNDVLRSKTNCLDNMSGVRERTAPEPLCDSVTVLSASGSDTALPGALLSNTAPANCIDDQNTILRSVVDSLYLSFKGCLFEEIEQKLIELKSLGQSDNPSEVASAVLVLEDHRFEVLGRGAKNFPYILKDGVFNIQLSKVSSEKLPLAYVQIMSEALTLSGLIPVVRKLKGILRLLGTFSVVNVSRVDVCCDFTTPVQFSDIPQVGWISRSSKRHNYFESGVFSGFVFGQGSPMSARLYDKTLEIKVSKKDYMKDIWWERGWDRESQVWRLEFQIKRSVLVQLGVFSFDDLLGTLNTLWEYATQNWLRLVLPGKDKTKARWPNHPLWADLQKADFGRGNQPLLKRCRSTREPGEQYLFINGLAAITSYMAIKNIETFEEAAPIFLADAKDYHHWRSAMTGESIEGFCWRHASLKARKYNTKFGKDKVDSADDYRKAKGRK